MKNKIRNVVVLVSALLLVSSVSAAETDDYTAIFTRTDYTDAGGLTLPYQRGVINPDARGKMALVVLLHGGSRCGDDGVSHLDSGALNHILEYLENHSVKAMVVAPQCPTGRQWNEKTTPVTDHVAKTLSRILATTPAIDRTRVYVCGYSMGGAGAWRLMNDYPSLFAAALIGAGAPLFCDATAVAASPVWAAAGSADTIVKAERVEPFIAQLLAAGGTARYSLLEGADHGATCGDTFSDERLVWLFSQRENDDANHGTVFSIR